MKLRSLGKERLGTKLFNQRRSFQYHNDTLSFATVTDMVHGAGQGHNLMLWQKPQGADLWQINTVRPERKPTMISILPLEHRAGETLIVYVDRQHDEVDKDRRVVYVDRLKGTEQIEEVFSYSDNKYGVLNPVCVLVPERDIAYLFIPDRGKNWRVRWFRIDLETDSVKRLEDIPMPAKGARLFEYHRDGNRLILPVGLEQQLHLLEIDLAEETHNRVQIDEAESPDNQPCRAVDIFPFEEKGMFLLTYLRPTSFSRRPRTGLLGEFVAHTVDAKTLESVSETVIGGYSAEKAATHQVATVKAGDNAFVSGYTTVDKIHQRHLTGKYKNFVAGHLDLWKIEDDGRATRLAGRERSPFWRIDLAFDPGEKKIYMLWAETQKTFPLWLETWTVE
ncbi:MAG: hypothetical protein ACOCWJ_00285 [Verrucomicrobiota bacterium]